MHSARARVYRDDVPVVDVKPAHLRLGKPPYPHALRKYLGKRAPRTVTYLGNLDVLKGKTLALFCSIRCPGDVILKTYDAVRSLRDKGVTVVAGFHSPMEKECLRILLRGKQPLIVCPARSIERLRIPIEWREPLRRGRLLVLSPFTPRQRRVTAELAALRNEFVAALADRILIAHAEPGGKTAYLARQVTNWRKRILIPGDVLGSGVA